MSTQHTSAGVNLIREPIKIQQIQGAPTSVGGMLGVTERGPIGVPTRVRSFEEFVNIFGGYITHGDAPHAVEGFFTTFPGGELIFTRTAHYTDITNANSHIATKATGTVQNAGAGSGKAVIFGRAKAPFALADGQTLVVQKDGVPQPTLTVNGTRALADSGNSENQDMSGGKTLDIQIDGGPAQTITFVDGDFAAPAAATAEEVAAVINAQLAGGWAEDNGGAVRISSDTLGSNSRVQVSAGDAQTLWNWPCLHRWNRQRGGPLRCDDRRTEDPSSKP